MNTKTVPASISETAFACPHCGAYTTQYWHEVSIDKLSKDKPLPFIPSARYVEQLKGDPDIQPETLELILEWAAKMKRGFPFVEKVKSNHYANTALRNVFVSECYNCQEFAVWISQSLVYPPQREGEAPSDDLPADIATDFEEARAILNRSSRGAAALLRLCIQKLCAVLGEKGRNIDDDIASLVKKGLNPLVQKSLDVVRVIGNEAVHPGSMDIRDDRATALQLLRIVNLIVEQMITLPKSITELYEALPEGKLAAIDRRNEQALK